MNALLIKNGFLIDPANNIEDTLDLLIVEGRVVRVGKNLSEPNAQILDVKGAVIAPGFIDVHVHLREPGQEYKETIATGTRAAARGGFTSVCCMANTLPVNDCGAITEAILKSARDTGVVNVFPIGAVTKNLEGKELSEIGELKNAGCVALSDDGRTIDRSSMFRTALEYTKGFDLPIISHCLCSDLMGKGVMNEGFVSTELGLTGIPHVAEDIIISRDILLAELTQSHVHIAHTSTAGGVDLVRQAKKKRIAVSCEVTPHHFTLTDDACRSYDPNTKMAPPLRTQKDIEAIKQALCDGTVDVIATDHAPHALSEKELDFQDAPFGIIGLETALPLSLRLVDEKVISLKRLIELLSVNPSRLMKLERGSLKVGAIADVVIFDPKSTYRYDVSQTASKSRNSPFHGWEMKGKVLATIVGGRVVYSNEG